VVGRPLGLDHGIDDQPRIHDLPDPIAERAMVLDIGGRPVLVLLDVGPTIEVRRPGNQTVRPGIVGKAPADRMRHREHPPRTRPEDPGHLAHDGGGVCDERDGTERRTGQVEGLVRERQSLRIGHNQRYPHAGASREVVGEPELGCGHVERHRVGPRVGQPSAALSGTGAHLEDTTSAYLAEQVGVRLPQTFGTPHEIPVAEEGPVLALVVRRGGVPPLARRAQALLRAKLPPRRPDDRRVILAHDSRRSTMACTITRLPGRTADLVVPCSANPQCSPTTVHLRSPYYMTAAVTDPTTKTYAQVAINDIGTADDFLAAIEGTIKEFNDGDIVEGTIVRVDRDEVLLDIGYKTEGVIPSRELSIKHDVDPNEVVTVGDEVEALVLQKEDKEGRLILSKKRAQYERAWGTIEQIKDEDGIVTGTVIEVVKGGLILDIGLRGFLPASLVEMRRVRDLQPYVGKELEAKIIELDKNRNNVVLSRRAWLEQTQSEVRQNFLTQLLKGQVRKGVVSSIVNFGAFVDLGGVDGLVHVSELSWKHIDHPSEVVEVGQEVTVEVLDVDMDRERVSLSLKATQEDPWQAFARTHAIGQVVPGRVTKLVPFGAFVRVAEGIEGLVHISELAERHVEIPEQVVNVGDEIYVKVIDIDLERRRISLSLKQANEGTVGEAVAEHFDPTQYGMPAQYDEAGNYIYPEGFDSDTNEWKPGYEAQQAEWEAQYAKAHERWEAHQKQMASAQAADAEAAETTSYTSEPEAEGEQPNGGTLASDEALAELRRKLTGGEGEDAPDAAESPADPDPDAASE